MNLMFFFVLTCYVQSNAKVLKISEKQKVEKELIVSSLELDGPTQEFSLGTPRIRMHYQEPSTPEMPDLSSVTLDICKVSFAYSHKNIIHLKADTLFLDRFISKGALVLSGEI